MRISAEDVAKRKALVTHYFQSRPETMRCSEDNALIAAGKFIKKETGIGMSPKTILEIFRDVKEKYVSSVAREPKSEKPESSRPPPVSDNVVFAFKTKIREMENLIGELKDENRALKQLISANRTTHGRIQLVDVPSDLTPSQENAIVLAMRGVK